MKTAKKETCMEGVLKRRTEGPALGKEVGKGLLEKVTVKTDT